MPDLFTLSFELGPEAPMPAVAKAIGDLSVVGDASLELASPVAEAEARRSISELVNEGGFRALAARIRERELPASDSFGRNVGYLEEDAEELDLLAREVGIPFGLRRSRGRYSYSALLAGLFDPGWSGVSTPWEPALRQLFASETADRLPVHGIRVRSLRYGNPVSAELVVAGGTASVAFGYLVTVIATLGPRRRRENARADAEERIQAAHARDVEDLVERRVELRRLLSERIARGEIDLRPDDITEALLDKIAGAADRLGERQLSFERAELPRSE